MQIFVKGQLFHEIACTRLGKSNPLVMKGTRGCIVYRPYMETRLKVYDRRATWDDLRLSSVMASIDQQMLYAVISILYDT